MPLGVIVNSSVIIIGGLIGTLVGNNLSDDFKDKINMIFGCCSMAMGISTIVLMENMPGLMQKLVSRFIAPTSGISEEDFNATLLTVIVLFCASGTGIYGSLVAGMSGDHSILFAKSILDLFTALIFACTLGAVVCAIAVPQFIIFFILFALGGVIIPHTTPSMINDFKACGGFLMLATGFRMIKVKMFPTADMLPSMVLVMPVSLFWVSAVMPAVASLVH